MNFPNNLRKFGIIFFSSFSLTIFSSLASPTHYQELGLPYFQHIIPPPYYGITLFQSIIQDTFGYIYFGGNNGVLQYDGSRWANIALRGQIFLVKDKNGQIYAGGNNIFGRIEYSSLGLFYFSSLLTDASGLESDIGQTTSIISANNNVYVLTDIGLFQWDYNTFTRIELDQIPDAIFTWQNKLLLCSRNYGIKSFVAGNESPIPGLDLPVNTDVSGIFTSGDSLFILTRQNGIHVFSGNHISSSSIITKELFQDVNISNGITLMDHSTVLGSSLSGILIINPNHQHVTKLDIHSGLLDNSVNQLFVDRSGNLWIAHNTGLTRLEWPSPFSYFNQLSGLSGSINSVIRHNNRLYAATSEGIFYLDNTEKSSEIIYDNKFIQVTSIRDECYQLISCGETLLVLSESGICKIWNGYGMLLLPGQFNILHPLKSDSEIVLTGSQNGLYRIMISDNDLSIHKVSEKIDQPVTGIVQSGNDDLWISTSSNHLFRIRSGNDFKNINDPDLFDFNNIISTEINWLRLYQMNGIVMVSTSSGILSFDPESERFVPNNQLPIPLSKNKEYIISHIYEDIQKDIWIQTFHPWTNKAKTWIASIEEENKYKVYPVPNDRLDDQIIRNIYSDDDGIIWIASQQSLIRFDKNYQVLNPYIFSSRISRIIIDDDSIVIPDAIMERLKIEKKRNNIRFEFNSTDLIRENSGLFQYKLDGFDSDWSEWNDIMSADYINLPTGKYRFEVRSKNNFGYISDDAWINLRIMPPVYLIWWICLIYLFIILVGIYFVQKWNTFRQLQKRYRLEEIIQERTEALIKEKEKSENLLANILPKKTADELKTKGKATSSKFKMVTVLFADIQGFTKIAEQMNPEKLIDELDKFYFQFDSVVEKYNIEKIKTIGDAYMAAGGIPIKNRTNPVEVVLAAMEMQHYMANVKKSKADIWDLRIGIHTGSVIAGVVGQKKFSYDIWGDTVNTASRMESSGEIGKVNISASTYELIKEFFNCEYRGKMPVKYKGDIEMYFVKGIKSGLIDDNQESPNQHFLIKIQLLRLLDLEEFIIQKLEDELPENLYFHNAAHTAHVFTQVELLGRSENVSVSDLLLLKSAALLHDIGYIDNIEDHENRSVEMAREILPLYKYKEDQIEQIIKLIEATKMPPDPDNLLEKIICDANLDHLGRIDFLIQSDKLFQEYRALNKVKSKKEWNDFQIDFITKHDYYTPAAQKLREVEKAQQIENIKQYS